MTTKKQNLLKLVSWAESLGYEVIFCKDGGNNICFETNSIEICSSKKIDERIFILAHECGHIADKNSRIKLNIPNSDLDKKKKIRLWEEMNAWVEARKILIKLNIDVDESKFANYSSQCLTKYIIAFTGQEEI